MLKPKAPINRSVGRIGERDISPILPMTPLKRPRRTFCMEDAPLFRIY